MLSSLSHVTRHLQFSISTSFASVLLVFGRVYYSSTPEKKPTRIRPYVNRCPEAAAQRYATDPEYRERRRAANRRYYAENKDALTAYHRRDLRENPEKHRAMREKYKSTFDFDQRYYAPRRSRWASDHHYHQRESLRTWITTNSWVRDLAWPTHKPVYAEEKILRQCLACHRYRHIKLWWQDKKTDDFLCHPCFTNDWSRALPIGHQDKVFSRRKSSETKPGSTSKPEP